MRERELFLAALDIEDPVARQAHLKAECAGDVELLARVEALLKSHESQSQFLNTPVVEQISDATDAELPATTFFKSDSTRNSDPEAPTLHSDRAAAMTEHQDDPADEVALGFLDPSSRPDSLGRLGHYEVLEVIGHGAFGTVLRAFDEKLQRVVAIKVLAPEMATTSPARKRFLREARASAAIRHENVVSIYAVEEKPLPHLVMEFIPGQTLQQRLNQVGPLTVPTVLRLGRQIAEGLAAAHAQDLIHRDIKPGNILLETSVHERVKITDFGLARTADDASVTQSGTIAGTPMYMAPEQAMGHKLDQRADLFSFGSVMYQMVSGRPPFRAATTLAVLKRLAEDTPRPIREIIPETPQWLCDIITKLHAKNPDERYQSAQEIAEVLADCEAQLKAHSGLKDFSLIPNATTRSASWWKWIAAAVVVLPLVAFGLSALNRPAATVDLGEKRDVSRDGESPAEPQVAEKLNSERDDLAKHGSAGASRQVRKSEDRDPDRDVAKWVLKNGGAVLLVNRGGLIENVADLPPDPFTVFHVIIRNQPKFTEADGVRLAQLRGLINVGFIDTTLEPGAIKALAGIRLLHELGFSRGMTSEATLTELLSIPQLRTLELGQVAATDDLIAKLGSVSQLLALHTYACPQVTEGGLMRLAASPPPKLQRLSWGVVKLSAAALKATASLPHLQTLSLTNMELDDTGLSELAHCPNLSEIVLDRSTGVTAGAITDLQQKLRGCQVVVTDPELASPMYGPPYRETIRNLMARGFDIAIKSNTSVGAVWFKGDAKLPLGDVVIAHYVFSQNMNDRTASDPETSDLRMLAQLTDLPALGVSNLPAGGLRELLPLKNLTTLNLASSQLTEADFALLPTFRKLSELRVVITNKSALETVATLPHLSRFTFEAGSTVADGDLKALESVRTLSTLDLVFTTISREAAQAFANARPDVYVNWKDGIRLEPVIGGHGWHANTPTPAIAPFDAAQARAYQEAWAKHLGVPVEYTNSIGMKFVLIPPGEFTMGSTATEIEAALKEVDPDDNHWKRCIKSEAPQHKVILTQPIYLGVNEVTQVEYEKVMGMNPAHFAPTGMGKESVAGLETANHPVEMVSWNDAAEFCAKLSEQQKLKPFYTRADETVTPLDGTGYRLPSEAEWEFACRAGTATKYWISDKDEDLMRAGWFGDPAGGRTHAAGKLEANPFGLFDIHGNVWEWVQDGWNASNYGQSQEKPAINPNSPFSAGSERVFRGGAWDYAASRCRSSGRGAYDTSLRSFLIGFRVSLSVDGVKAAITSSNSIDSAKAKRNFASDEWIDVIPLIDPPTDKWDVPQRTGKNAWRIENGELVVSRDALASKLLLPLDSEWPAYECELEFTRRAGNSGFNVNLPTRVGECPLLFDPTGNSGAFLGSRAKGVQLKTGTQLVTGERTTIRFDIRRQQAVDHVSVALNGAAIGEWNGDRTEISYSYREGFPHDRRVSLWIHPGGNEFVFHRIRVRMLDGSTAESLREVTSTPLVPVVKQQLPPTFQNSIGMEFVIVPKGKSWLRDKEVEIPANFYLGKYEVTQEEWEKVMGYNPSHFGPANQLLAGMATNKFPVESVNWYECVEYCNKLSEREGLKPYYELKVTKRSGKGDLQIEEAVVKILGGKGYHIPTDVEWDHGCRAGSKTGYHCGNDDNVLLEYAWFDKNSDRRSHAVGEKKPNAFGLHDMHGNVLEWNEEMLITERGQERIARGGDLFNVATNCAVNARLQYVAAIRLENIGLRLARLPSGDPSSEAKTTSTAVAPFTDADINRIAALPAIEQVEEVRQELKKRNPDFDGKLTPTIEDDVITGLEFFTNHLLDISPVRALPRLTSLNCRAEGSVLGLLSDLKPLKGMQLVRLTLSVNPISDITPLKGMPLTDLHIDNSHVADLSPLEGMQLKVLNCSYTKVASLAPLKGMPLIILWCNNTEIADLSPVKGMPLEWITIQETKINDISPLKGMPLTQIYLDFQPKRDTEFLQTIRTLVKINDKPAAEFWKETERK